MVKEFREEFFTDGKVLHCSICNEVVKCEKKSQVTQHRLTKKHSPASGRHSTQQLVSTFNTASKKPKSDDYSAKLCNALIAADIPFNKLKKPIFSSFLEEFTSFETPDESTLRKSYLPKLYDNTILFTEHYVTPTSGSQWMRPLMSPADILRI